MEDVQEKVVEAKKLGPKFVRKKTLQATLQEVSMQMYARNKELKDTNEMLSLLRKIDKLVLDSHESLNNVCHDITQAIADSKQYAFTGLFTRSNQSKQELTLYGWTAKNIRGQNIDIRFSNPLHLRSDDDLLLSVAPNKFVSLQSVTTIDLATALDCPESDIKNLLHKLPLQSLYTIKLEVRHRFLGLLLIGFSETTTGITEPERDFLQRLSYNIGVALDNKLLFEENQHVLRQLQVSNTKLKALDEAKDDFISMASHQLRTPLTSIKGYISMIKDGDAGKVNPTQEQMLEQAFFSSQRMVYLIADLLNVSRLRTGKFIIETVPVNLAKVITEEIGQLKDIAASRTLTLSYTQPKEFPSIMLDETKTRQVIMNFIDNAIYYTPSGGHITVELVDKPTTVEMHVRDDGIGVSKSDQPHLFTKFYRAGNARKARPDGTGLGLFMAKKVIVAQGGALIFTSKEGEGSDFGFIFSKTKLAVPKTDSLLPVDNPKNLVKSSKKTST